MEAAELEGTNRGWPVGVLSRHMALHRLRERASEAECERRCESFEGSPLDGWLRSRSLRRRTLGGLAEPRAGECKLIVCLLSRPHFRGKTSAEEGMTVQA